MSSRFDGSSLGIFPESQIISFDGRGTFLPRLLPRFRNSQFSGQILLPSALDPSPRPLSFRGVSLGFQQHWDQVQV